MFKAELFGRWDGGVDGEEGLKDGAEAIEVEGVGAVGLGFGGVVVDLEEDAVDACGHCGASEDGDELGLAAGDGFSLWAAGAGGGGCLDGVGGVEDDW